MLRLDVALPFVLAGKGRFAACEVEDAGEGAGVLLLDVVVEGGLVFELLGAVGAGVDWFAGGGWWRGEGFGWLG